MKTYEITLSKMYYCTATITLMARDETEAERKALKQAGYASFEMEMPKGCAEVEHVEEVESK